MARRAGIFEALEERCRAYQYGGEDAAISIRQDQEERRDPRVVHDGHLHPTPQRSLFDTTDTDAAAEATS